MKTEDSTPSPAVQTSYTTTWTQPQIDPALQQQQHQQQPQPQPQLQQPPQHQPTPSPYQYYSQAQYGQYAQYYLQQQQHQQHQYQQHQPVPQQQPVQTTSVARPAPQSNQSNGIDTSDIATLNDALGSAGVDLRAEEESLHRTYDSHQTYRTYEDRTRKQPPKPNFETHQLSTTMRQIATSHKIQKIPDDTVNYLALSLRARLQSLITDMIAASAHRTDTQFDRPASTYEAANGTTQPPAEGQEPTSTPMWGIRVRSDVAKQLAALEKVEREEEMKVRRERKERAEMAAAHAAHLAAQANGQGSSMSLGGGGGDADEEGPAKKKRKKEGPGVTARNMSEDVRKKMSNAVASQAAGLGGKYAWMTAANAAPATPKPKPGAANSATTSAPTTTAPAQTPGSWVKPYVSQSQKSAQGNGAGGGRDQKEDDNRRQVTLRDAMFVIAKEKGHGGGRGSARGWV